MLKARSAYASQETFDYCFFKENATVQTFALNPALRIQIKFLFNNEKTAHTQIRNRFVICNEDSSSRMMFKKDAEEILDLLEVIKNPLVKQYQTKNEQIRFDDIGNGSLEKPSLTVLMKGEDVRICSWNTGSISDRENNPEMVGKEFGALVDRLTEILKAFLDHNEGKPITIENHFAYGRYMFLPLSNKGTDVTAPHYLRLNWTGENRVNNICLSAKGRNILFYSLNKENTSTLPEICEGFIDALYRVVDDFNKVTEADIDTFISTYSVQLSEDRKHFMEYVGARGMTVPNGDEPLKKSMLIQMNSDAAPASSKTMLRYDAQFVNDLIDGLRFCYEYKI